MIIDSKHIAEDFPEDYPSEEENHDEVEETPVSTASGGSLLERIKALALPIIERESCRLYSLEFVSGSRGKGRTLRLYIDRVDGAVSLEDCANVSRGLNLILDVDDAVPGEAYVLEVSSPGLEKPLKEKWHFESALNERVHLKTNESINGQKAFTGKLVSVADEGFVLELDNGDEVKVSWDIVHKGKLIYDFGQNQNTKKNANKKNTNKKNKNKKNKNKNKKR